MKTIPNSVVNKAAFGELTLGEVWDFVGERVQMVMVADSEFKWGPFENISITPRLRLEVFEFSFEERGEDAPPEYSFDFGSKVTVKGDHLEIIHRDGFGDEEKLALYFMYRPDPQVINLGFLLGK